LPSSPSFAAPSPPSASVQEQNAGSSAPAPDALQLRIKTALDESRSLQTSLKQLSIQDDNNAHSGVFSDQPVVLGLEGLLLGAATVCLGALLGSGLAWARTRSTRAAAAPADFGESVYSFRTTDEAHPLALEDIQESISPPDAPALAPYAPSRNEVDLDAHCVASAGLFAPAESGTGFDFEAAASEVQRVRRSLADKRAARDRWHASEAYHPDAIPPDAEISDDMPLEVDPFVPLDHALDIPQDLDIDLDMEIEAQCAPTPEPPAPTPAMEEVVNVEPELHDMIDLDLDHTERADKEGDQGLSVKLELAQEFLSLGLLDGAREFALEFMDSTDASLHSQAMTLIGQVDVQEQQEQERAQQAKLQAQQNLDAMFASLPTQ
jgi:hypothetical protein